MSLVRLVRFSFIAFALTAVVSHPVLAAVPSTDIDRAHAVDCAEARSARSRMTEKSSALAGPNVSRIDVRSEYASFNLAALKLRTLARFGRCDLHLTEKDENFTVRDGATGTVDEFEVAGTEREVITWHHAIGHGVGSAASAPQVVHFSSRGEVDSLR